MIDCDSSINLCDCLATYMSNNIAIYHAELLIMSYTRVGANPFPVLTKVMKTLESVQSRQQINASIICKPHRQLL